VSQADLKALLERAETLYRDNTLESVRQWKGRTGGLAVGFMPIYVPRELFHAQGVLPVGIMGGGEDLEIIRGDAYFQSYICHIPRSTIELGLNGSLDCLDGMIFPAICDVIRNLSGMWKLQFPDKLSSRRAAPVQPIRRLCRRRSPSTTRTAAWCGRSSSSGRSNRGPCRRRSSMSSCGPD